MNSAPPEPPPSLTTLQQLEEGGALSQFASSIAHEVCNPLSQIVLATDLLAGPRPMTDDFRKKIVTFLRQGSERIDKAMKSMLQTCTPIETSMTAEDANALIEAALASLTVDATVNPDFGQIEADPAVLNLTAFEVRFEERRPFFQEGVGLFRCGGPCEGIFYTRRIGRAPQLRTSSAEPNATTILGAAKVTGRLNNGLSVGFVEAVTRREVGLGGRTVEPGTNYLVARAVKEMRQGRSALGVMGTAVNRDLDPATQPFLRREAYTFVAQGYHRFAGDRWEGMLYTGENVVRGSREAIARTQLSSIHYYQRPDHEETFDPARTSLRGGVVGGSLTKLRGSVRYNNFIRAAGPGLELNDLGFVPVVNDLSLSGFSAAT